MNSTTPSLRKNPSRESCEIIIKRILAAEVHEKGKNEHFRSATDFMSYFESLYPASEALTKQVQRAIKSLDMPKDELGYFIPDKTKEELEHEKELSSLFAKADASVVSLENCEPVLLKVDNNLKSYLMHLLETSPLFKDTFLTLLETRDGILFYTKTPSQLKILLNSLIVR